MTASLRTGALLGRGKRGWRKALLTTALAIGAGYLSAPVFGQTLDDDSGQEVGPAPGTITVRLNGRVRIWGGIDADGDANRAVFTNVGVPSGAAVSAGTAFLSPVVSPGGPGSIPFGTIGVRGPGTTVVAAPAGTALQFNKQADYTITSYTRLYPGFDGVAANGLKYGASIEIRQDNSADAGGGVYGSISQQSRQRGELYIRREWGYIGTDQLGTLRIGSTDGPSGLYMVGNFENFNDGGWNGDIQNQIAMNVAPVWPFATPDRCTPRTKSYISRRNFTASISASPMSRTPAIQDRLPVPRAATATTLSAPSSRQPRALPVPAAIASPRPPLATIPAVVTL